MTDLHHESHAASVVWAPVTPLPWMTEARCTEGVDPDLFAPIQAETVKERNRRVTQAQAVCDECPVAVDCLLTALRGRESGVWAGILLDGGHPVQPYQPPRQPHGTYAAYRCHNRDHTEPCEPCKTAYSRRRANERHRMQGAT